MSTLRVANLRHPSSTSDNIVLYSDGTAAVQGVIPGEVADEVLNLRAAFALTAQFYV